MTAKAARSLEERRTENLAASALVFAALRAHAQIALKKNT